MAFEDNDLEICVLVPLVKMPSVAKAFVSYWFLVIFFIFLGFSRNMLSLIVSGFIASCYELLKGQAGHYQSKIWYVPEQVSKGKGWKVGTQINNDFGAVYFE